LAELTAFIESGCGEKGGEAAPVAATTRVGEAAAGQLTGIPASAGIAIGPIVKLRPAIAPIGPRVVDDPEAEQRRLKVAIHDAEAETRALYDWARSHAGEAEAGIFDAQLLFLDDPELDGAASHSIVTDHVNAEFAWQSAAGKLAQRLDALEDPYLRTRAADVADVAARVLRKLGAATEAAFGFTQPSIIAAHDLTPSEVQNFDSKSVLGVCLETGSATAHSVILVRAMGIPAVVGLGPGISALLDGTKVAIDGQQGRVWVSPDEDESQAIDNRRKEWLAAREAAQQERHKPAATRDGHRIQVLANLKGVTQASNVLDAGAEGVGLPRTEFLFLSRSVAPSEQEQFAAYRNIAEALGPRPLVIRTLDIGGDKPVPYIEIGGESNPVLGWRGIRVMLGRRDLLRTQLRAILRAGCGHAVDIMFPMISSLVELREAKAAVDEAEAELKREGVTLTRGKMGIMVEVPAAVIVADQLARESDFFSIGSNDLIQYTMAADRTNARVAALADPFQPAVLRMLQQAIEAARRAGIGVCLCGELAADPLATPVLIGLGLEEFSVSPNLIPGLKQSIASWSRADAEAIARQALLLDTSAEVRRYLSSTHG
jgi:phosphocarrier protein FPr